MKIKGRLNKGIACLIVLVLFGIGEKSVQGKDNKKGQKELKTQEIQITKQKIRHLMQDLDSESELVRSRAIEDLGNLKVKEAVPKIIDSLKDEEWMVKAQVAVALGKIKDKRAVPYLIERLKDKKGNWSI